MLRRAAISIMLASALPAYAQLDLPFWGTANTQPSIAAFGIENTGNGPAIVGIGTGWHAAEFFTPESFVGPAVLVQGKHGGEFIGLGPVGIGVFGTGSSAGGSFSTNGSSGNAVSGSAFAATGLTCGGYFENFSDAGTALYGFARATSGATYGGRFVSAGQTGFGVYGEATAPTGVNAGGSFTSRSTGGVGVKAVATAGSGFTIGGYFESASPDGNGVYGLATAASGPAWGVIGQTSSPAGLGGYFSGPGDALWATTAGVGKSCVVGVHTGAGDGYGLYGQTNGTTGAGVFGRVYSTTGPTLGGLFVDYSTSGTGAAGYAYATTGITSGLYGQSDSGSGTGVYGKSTASTGATIGVSGEAQSASGYGVKGRNMSSGNYGYMGVGSYGVYAVAGSSAGMGVRGDSLTSNSGVGVYGRTTNSAGGFGVYSLGRFGASGTKSFRIDHPLDPENMYLNHYCTESPEVLNAYRGTVRLDGAGGATVRLPNYFALVNKQPSYTLTAVGEPMPLLHVSGEIDESALAAGAAAAPGDAVTECSFRIAGGSPGGKVCWRIEAVRNDRWVRTYGAPVETAKQAPEKGTYQYPELYGQPEERGTVRQPDSREGGEAPVTLPNGPTAAGIR